MYFDLSHISSFTFSFPKDNILQFPIYPQETPTPSWYPTRRMAQNVPLSSSPCSLILMHHFFFFFFFFDATIGFKGPLPAQILPSALTHLVVNNLFNIPLDDLPLSVTHLTLGGRFNQKIDHLPSSLKYPQSLLLIS